MSERNLVALGVGAIGFLVGGPAGFSFGFTLGGLIGALLFPEKIKGPRVKDREVQISSYGESIPLAWGWNRMAGNVIWATDIVEKKKEETQFLGPTTVTYKYYGNFAIAFCEGEVKRWKRIWADNKLILERDEFGRIKGKGKRYVEFYYGDEEQLPSPLQEEWDGAGNVPGYRGIAYLEFEMMKLSDYGNRLPSINAEFFAGTQKAEPAGDWIAITDGFRVVGMNKNWCISVSRVGSTATVRGHSLPDGVLQWESTVPNVDVFSDYHLTKNGILVVTAADNIFSVYTVDCDDGGDVKGPYPLSAALGDRGSGILAFQTVTSRKADDGYHVSVYWSNGSTQFGLSGDGSMYLSQVNLSNVWATMMIGGQDYIYFTTVTFGSPDVYMGYSAGTGAIGYIDPSIAPIDPFSIYYDETEDCVAVVDGDNSISTYKADLSKRIKRRELSFAVPPNDNNFVSAYNGFTDGSIVVKETGGTNNIFHEFSLPYVRELQVINANVDTLWDQKNHYFITYGVNPVHNLILVYDVDYTRLWFLPPREWTMTLKQVVRDINLRAGLVEGTDFDVSALDDREVVGYYVNKEASARDMLEPLMGVYFFDGIETDGKVIYQHKNRPSFATIDTKYLGSANGNSQAPLLIEGRTQELDMPAEITLKYPSQALDYNQNGQKARRAFETQYAEQRTTMEVPLVITDEDAKLAAEIMLLDAWAGRTSYEFTLPRRYIFLNPGDAVTLAHDGREFLVYIESIDTGANGLLNVKARSHSVEIYDGIGLPAVVPPITSPPPGELGRATTKFIDGPLLEEGLDSYALFYAAGEGLGDWPGSDILMSPDNVTFNGVGAIQEEAVIGYTATALGNAANHCAIDYENTLLVILGDGSLSSVTLTDMLANGANYAMVGDELIQFQRATLVDPDSAIYELSWFVRGCKGTEWAMGLHDENERFILIQPGYYGFVPVANSDIGKLLYWKSVTFGLDVEETSSFLFTPQINQWKPLTVAHLFAYRSSNDWHINWVRRARKNFEWRDIEAPLDEPYERYEIDIMSGSTVKRTITVDGATSCTYTSAQQISDFGSVRSSITINVYQISSRAGRGHATNRTF